VLPEIGAAWDTETPKARQYASDQRTVFPLLQTVRTVLTQDSEASLNLVQGYSPATSSTKVSGRIGAAPPAAGTLPVRAVGM
jgi:hypothetical protein